MLIGVQCLTVKRQRKYTVLSVPLLLILPSKVRLNSNRGRNISLSNVFASFHDPKKDDELFFKRNSL